MISNEKELTNDTAPYENDSPTKLAKNTSPLRNVTSTILENPVCFLTSSMKFC